MVLSLSRHDLTARTCGVLVFQPGRRAAVADLGYRHRLLEQYGEGDGVAKNLTAPFESAAINQDGRRVV